MAEAWNGNCLTHLDRKTAAGFVLAHGGQWQWQIHSYTSCEPCTCLISLDFSTIEILLTYFEVKATRSSVFLGGLFESHDKRCFFSRYFSCTQEIYTDPYLARFSLYTVNLYSDERVPHQFSIVRYHISYSTHTNSLSKPDTQYPRCNSTSLTRLMQPGAAGL